MFVLPKNQVGRTFLSDQKQLVGRTFLPARSARLFGQAGGSGKKLRQAGMLQRSPLGLSHQEKVGRSDILVRHKVMAFNDEIKIRHRHLPHWTMKDAVYFITFNIWEGEFDNEERSLILNHIISGNDKFYHLFSAVVMPDHVHLIIEIKEKYNLERVMKGIKGVSAKLVNEKRETKGRIWQDEYFDRIIRDYKEYDEKITYMFENPIRKGLVKDNEEYQWWFINNE